MFLSSICIPFFLLTAIDATPIWRRTNTFTVPTLPYDTAALAPHISAATNNAHLEILTGAVAALNAQNQALIAAAAKGDLDGVIAASTLTLKTSGALQNHIIYFNSLAPVSKGGGDTSKASAAFTAQVNKDFGSFDNLQKILISKTATVPASGWGFLVWDLKNLALDIITTNNEEHPPPDFVPLLDIDIFEHAFYLDYQDKAAEYLGNLTDIFNWEYASSAFQNATSDTRAFVTSSNTNSKSAPPATFTLPTLPYDVGALAPHISKETNLAHLDILTGAVAALNANNAAFAAAVSQGDLVGVIAASQVILKVSGAIQNHIVYFNSLAPTSSGGGDTSKASAAFTAQVIKDFGSFDALQKDFLSVTATVPASGWGFLVWDTLNMALDLIITENEEHPPATLVPILDIDVFEHAYYLDYHQQTSLYLNNLTSIFNWAYASSQFASATHAKSISGDVKSSAISETEGPSAMSPTAKIVVSVLGALAALTAVVMAAMLFRRRRANKAKAAARGKYGFVGKNMVEDGQGFVRGPREQADQK